MVNTPLTFPQPSDKGQHFRGGPSHQEEVVQRQAGRQPVAPVAAGQGGQVPFEDRGKVLADQFRFVRRVAAVAAQGLPQPSHGTGGFRVWEGGEFRKQCKRVNHSDPCMGHE